MQTFLAGDVLALDYDVHLHFLELDFRVAFAGLRLAEVVFAQHTPLLF